MNDIQAETGLYFIISTGSLVNIVKVSEYPNVTVESYSINCIFITNNNHIVSVRLFTIDKNIDLNKIFFERI